MNIHKMLCFGRHAGSGNLAVVVEDASLPAAQRLPFAQQQQASATVFVQATAAGELELDYYYPHTRSPLCLHATLAASAVYFEQHPQAASVRLVTSMRRQMLRAGRDGTNVFIAVQPQDAPQWEVDPDLVARLLRTTAQALTGKPALASVGSPKLLVEVADRATLHALQPDLDGIVSWGRQHGISGMYVYCRLGEDLYAGRNFNHLDATLEDAATGVAAGALAVALRRSVTVQQGDLTGMPCTLLARYRDGAVQIGGMAVRAESEQTWRG